MNSNNDKYEENLHEDPKVVDAESPTRKTNPVEPDFEFDAWIDEQLALLEQVYDGFSTINSRRGYFERKK